MDLAHRQDRQGVLWLSTHAGLLRLDAGHMADHSLSSTGRAIRRV